MPSPDTVSGFDQLCEFVVAPTVSAKGEVPGESIDASDGPSFPAATTTSIPVLTAFLTAAAHGSHA